VKENFYSYCSYFRWLNENFAKDIERKFENLNLRGGGGGVIELWGCCLDKGVGLDMI